MKLLYRRVKNEDEFVVDYLKRIGTNNGFEKATLFRNGLRHIVDRHQNVPRSSLYDQAKWRIGLELCLARNIPCDEYRRVTSSKCFLWRKEPTLCEKCYVSAPYIRFYWWFSAYTNCHIHDDKVIATQCNLATVEQSRINSNLVRLIPVILNKSLAREDCQAMTLNEIDRCWCDFKILNGLNDYFPKNNYLKGVLLHLEAYLQSASVLHNQVDLRVSKMALYLANLVGSFCFWMRIICLLIFDHLSGLRSAFPTNKVASEYRKISIYFLSADKQLGRYISQISGHRSTNETLAVPLGSLLLSEVEFSAEFIRAYRYSLFRCKTLNYFEQFLGNGISPQRFISNLFSDTDKITNSSREC